MDEYKNINDQQEQILDEVEIKKDEEILRLHSEDFGHLLNGSPQEVVSPKNIGGIQKAIGYAIAKKKSLTIKGLGRSQSGQSLAGSNALNLDLSSLKTVEAVNSKDSSIRCEGGATWKQVLEQTLPLGLIPPAIPLNLNLTVGGTLSVGGVGTSSHQFGSSAANVKSLEVVNAKSERVACSRELNKDYFEAALGNLGRCVVIGSAELELRKIKANIRTFFLLYDDIKAWVQDQRFLVNEGKIAHLQGVCTSSVQGLRKGEFSYSPFVHWFYGLQISYEFDSKDEMESHEVLFKNLNYYKLLHFEDDSVPNFYSRFEPRFDLMKKTGMEYQAHPWVECILPIEMISEVLPKVLKILPLSLGDGHRLIFLSKKNNPRFLRFPDAEENAVFAILPMGIAPFFLKDTLKVLEQVHRILIEAGGKRYLSGWLNMMNVEDWKNHYGNEFEAWKALKSRMDPSLLFQSKMFNEIGL